MKHLATNYWTFKYSAINETIDQNKIDGLKDRIRNLERRLTIEKDINRKRKLQLEIKLCQLKIEIAQIP